MRVYVECGRRWWRYSSWVPYKYPGGRDWSTFFRKLPRGVKGFAVGPIMFIAKEKKS